MIAPRTLIISTWNGEFIDIVPKWGRIANDKVPVYFEPCEWTHTFVGEKLFEGMPIIFHEFSKPTYIHASAPCLFMVYRAPTIQLLAAQKLIIPSM